jgi:flagellar hook-length control protein FliK
MNNYQPATAVSTLLSLDLGRNSQSLNRNVRQPDSSNEFGRVMADQTESRSHPKLSSSQDKVDHSRDHHQDDNEPSVAKNSKSNKSQVSDSKQDADGPTNDKSIKSTDTVTSVNDSSASGLSLNEDDPHAATELGESVEGSNDDLLVTDDVLELSIDEQDEETQLFDGGGSVALSETDSTLQEPVTQKVAQSEVDNNDVALAEDVIDEAGLLGASQETLLKTSEEAAKPAGQERVISENLPFRQRNIGTSSASASLSLAKGDAIDVSDKNTIELGVHKKNDSVAITSDIKPGVAKQMSNLIASLTGGQSAVNADQIFKEVASRGELGQQRGGVTAMSSLAGPANTLRSPGLPAQVSILQEQVKAGVGQPKWQTAIAERIAFMSSQKITSAEIRLDPPELGPLQVKVTINQEQASVAFSSNHAQVREALDQTSFRLREMFNSEGIDLVDVDVSDQSLSGQSDAERDSESDGNSNDSADEEVVTQIAVNTSQSLVDHFV